MCEIEYPDHALKGIPNSEFLVEDGSVASYLFNFKVELARDDGWIEQSINWEDDGFTIERTLEQQKDNGELQFKTGVAKLPRQEIDRLNKRPTVNGILSYERKPEADKEYHGNILIRVGTPKPTMKKIAAGLALIVSEIIYRQQGES